MLGSFRLVGDHCPFNDLGYRFALCSGELLDTLTTIARNYAKIRTPFTSHQGRAGRALTQMGQRLQLLRWAVRDPRTGVAAASMRAVSVVRRHIRFESEIHVARTHRTSGSSHIPSVRMRRSTRWFGLEAEVRCGIHQCRHLAQSVSPARSVRRHANWRIADRRA
jgi:hypothetical protein